MVASAYLKYSAQISPEDIQWVDEDPGIPHRGGYGGSGHGMNRSVGRDGSGAGRGRGVPKSQSRKDFLPSQNGIGKKTSDDIRILHTETLIREVQTLWIYYFDLDEFAVFLVSMNSFSFIWLAGEFLVQALWIYSFDLYEFTVFLVSINFFSFLLVRWRESLVQIILIPLKLKGQRKFLM